MKLHRAQASFRRSSAIYRAFVGGRGTGKSWCGAYDLIRRAKRGRTYLVASPTAPLMNDTTFSTFRALAKELGVLGAMRMTPYPNVYLTTGAEVRFRTAEDPEKLRGPNLSGAWLDEASLMDREAFNITIACLREQGEQGWLSLTFTPKGTGHWTYDLFGKPRADTEVVHARTKDNPFLPSQFYETLKRQYPTVLAAQELEGEFLDADEAWQVIPTAWVRQSMERWTSTPPGPLSALGVDVARGGQDQTVIAPRHGRWIGPLRKHAGVTTKDGPAVMGLVSQALMPNPKAWVMMDAIGVGSSPYDFCRARGWNVFAVNFGAGCDARDSTGLFSFRNIRAYAYWSIRELLDPSLSEKERLLLPPDPELLADLTAPKWEMTISGVQIEKKEDIMERLGRSPDAGDAVACSVLRPPREWLSGRGQTATRLEA